MSDDFIDLIARQAEWSDNTFGPTTREKGVIAHIRKELAEIEQDPSDIYEWIDVMILAIDGAWRQIAYSGRDGNSNHLNGMDYRKIAEILLGVYMMKCKTNRERVWPDWRNFSSDAPIEHDRSKG